jgi:UDP-N-acetylglucosamine 3-dehydrogenase
VVGVGAFGRHHARIYSQLAEAELVALVDANPATREEVGRTFRVPTFAAASELPADVEAVSVAVPRRPPEVAAAARAACRC